MTKRSRKQTATLRTTIDRDLVGRLRQHARWQRVSMGEVVERALALYFGPFDDKFVDPDGIAYALEARARRQRQGQTEGGE